MLPPARNAGNRQLGFSLRGLGVLAGERIDADFTDCADSDFGPRGFSGLMQAGYRAWFGCRRREEAIGRCAERPSDSEGLAPPRPCDSPLCVLVCSAVKCFSPRSTRNSRKRTSVRGDAVTSPRHPVNAVGRCRRQLPAAVRSRRDPVRLRRLFLSAISSCYVAKPLLLCELVLRSELLRRVASACSAVNKGHPPRKSGKIDKKWYPKLKTEDIYR